MAGEQLVWELLAVDKASGVLKSVSKAFEDSDTKMQKAAKVSGMALAGAAGAAVLAGKESIGAAGDLAETTSKVSVLFGDQAAAIDKWAETADTALGQSEQSALDAASTFATFGQAAGLSGPALGKFSTDLTGLASDMASFSNTTPEDAIEAVGAALRGESEPIRRYGVLLDAATLSAQAMSMGLVKASKDTDKIKAAQLAAFSAQARYNEAVKKHGEDSREAQAAQAGLIRAQGALKKATEGSIPPLTNAQKVLAAQSAIMAQTKAAQGDFARTSTGAANKQRILSAQVANLSAKLGAALLPAFNQVLSVLTAGVALVSHHTTLFATLAGILAGVAAVIWTVNAAQTAWNAGAKIAAAATKVWTAIQWAWNAAMTANPIGLIIVGIAALVAGLVVAYKKSDTFRAIVTTSLHAVGAAFSWLWGAAKAVFGWLKDHWYLIAGILGGPFVGAIAVIIHNWDSIRKGVVEGADKVVTFVKGLPKKMLDALGDLGKILLDAGGKIMDGLLDGIKSGFNKVKDTLGNLTDLLPDWKGPAVRDRVLLRPAADLIMGGFTDQLAAHLPDVRGVMDSVTDAIPSAAAARPIRGVGSASARASAQVILQVTVQALDPTPAVGRIVVDAIERHLTRGGRVPPQVRTALAR